MTKEVPEQIGDPLTPRIKRLLRGGSPKEIHQSLITIAENIDHLWRSHFDQEAEVRILDERFLEHGHKGIKEDKCYKN